MSINGRWWQFLLDLANLLLEGTLLEVTKFFAQNNIELFCQPTARIVERPALAFHHQIDGAAIGLTHETTETVSSGVEGERGSRIIVKRTDGLVATHTDLNCLSDLLYWQVLKFLNVESR